MIIEFVASSFTIETKANYDEVRIIAPDWSDGLARLKKATIAVFGTDSGLLIHAFAFSDDRKTLLSSYIERSVSDLPSELPKLR